MTKTISIYAAQILLGVIAIAAGYAKLTGAGLMVQQFQSIGLGQGFLTVAGAAEILAGFCLLLPRGGILGALLLTCVMVGALGVTIGHVASGIAAPAPSFTATSYQATSSHDGAMRIFRQRTEWDI
jgi:uncharacterized membrane protein YphA (DoxX/SURF4 family)